MENLQPSTGKYALKFGIILAVAGIAFSLLLHFNDLQYSQSWANSLVSTLMLIIILVLAIYQFKKDNGGYLSLSQALKVGIGAAMIAGIISVIYLMLYVNVIEPEFMDRTAEITKSTLQQNPDLTPEQIETALKNQKEYFWITYPIVLIFNLFLGFVFSLITGLIMKKEKSDY
ncbi:DUF4199 domain-containing protein [Robertkochia solimangrovi]|uniref:DUF4199 domain-containing protein n=1 Tax=Robertkochia solimangrovi TaxID=2213046 RepID=UPI00117D2DFE|nr:DUF4199 domain-containing protein [Robertkochia solimangrovi]TRZ43681.1 DUF4199 domain-containing protein [Robertkochia solimangrovi]